MTRLKKIEQLFTEFERDYPEADLRRLKASLNTEESCESAIPTQRPGFLYLPFLPSAPWHEPATAQWAREFEAAFDAVADECASLYDAGRGFLPYREPGSAPPFWRGTWNTCYFFHSGNWFDETCGACPITSDLLKAVPRLDEYALFSALKPGTHIQPHCGPWNARLTYHFGICLPKSCWIRVGGESRKWVPGQFLVFDDSFEHEVFNHGPGDRIVLMFTVWHPGLSEMEIRFLQSFDSLFPIPGQDAYIREVRAQARVALSR